MRALGLQSREDAQRLGIPLEATDVGSKRVQGGLPVVTEGGMAQVVRETGTVDDLSLIHI